MAANTLEYKVLLDTSDVDVKSNMLRSRMSGVMGTPGGDFSAAASGLAGFAGAASSGYAMMRGGLESAHRGVGQYMDPSMAFEMHHGVSRAQSSLAQEWAAYRGGAQAVAPYTPHGVGAGAYAERLQENLAARTESAGAAFMGGAGTTAASWLVGWPVGAKIGSAIGTAIAPGVGTAIGGFAGGLIGSAAVETGLGKAVERGNKMFAEVSQLGELATAGRGMGKASQFEFGRGFQDMAKRMNISTNEMGDLVSGIRGAGMMPATKDVQQSLSQFEGMAKDIRDIAVGMQTSLGRATTYLRDVERLGMGRGAGGVFAAAQTAGNLGTSLSGLIGHVGMGRRVGMGTGIGGGTGAGLFLQSAFAGAQGLGSLTGEEQQMAGGALGTGRAFAMGAMRNAMGPWGQVQLMAMMGKGGAQALPGSMMGTLDQAAGNMLGSGNPMSAIISFENNRERMLNQLGGKGLRLMQAHAIKTEGDMLARFTGADPAEAYQSVARKTHGMSNIHARAMSGFIQRGYKDRTPSAGEQMLPGIFGGTRSADMAARVAVDTQARTVNRAIAQDSKMFWTRGIEWAGKKWSEFRQDRQVSAESDVQARLAEQGIFRPSETSMRMVSRAMAQGRSLGDTPVTSAGQLALQFAGVSSAGGTVDLADVRGRLRYVARNLKGEQSDRFKQSERASIDDAMVKIAESGHDRKAWVKDFDYNIGKASQGSNKHADHVMHDVRSLLDKAGQGYGKEFATKGLSGKRGDEIARILRKATGKDPGQLIRSLSGTFAASTAGLLDHDEAAAVGAAFGFKKKRKRTVIYAGGRSGRSTTVIGPAKFTREQQETIKKGRRLVASKEYRGLLGANEDLREDRRGVSQEDLSPEDRREANERARLANMERQDAEVKLLRKASLGGDSKERDAAKKLIQNANDADVKSMVDKSGLTTDAKVKDSKGRKRRGGKRRPAGRTVSFQGRAESFQSQVATALKKTAHTLDKVGKVMTGIEGKLKGKTG